MRRPARYSGFCRRGLRQDPGEPGLRRLWSAVGFAYAATPRTVVRGGFGISYVHYTRAGSGDILAINAPNALFVSVTQPKPGTAGYRTVDQGFPEGLATTFNPKTDNITYIPKNTRDSYAQDFFVSVQNELAKNIVLDIAYVGNHGVKLQGFLNANQINPAAGFARPYTNWPSDITTALNRVLVAVSCAASSLRTALGCGIDAVEFLHLVAFAGQRQRVARGQHSLSAGCEQYRRRLRAVGLQLAHREYHQPGLRPALWAAENSS